jgi:hypothetical protein
VVFRRQDDVPGPRLSKDIGPVGRIEQFGFEHRREGRIRKVSPISSAVILPPGPILGLVARDAIPVPLRVLAPHRPGRDRIQAPVNKDPELRVRPPLRRRPPIQRLPLRLVFLRRSDLGRQEQHRQNARRQQTYPLLHRSYPFPIHYANRRVRPSAEEIINAKHRQIHQNTAKWPGCRHSSASIPTRVSLLFSLSHPTHQPIHRAATDSCTFDETTKSLIADDGILQDRRRNV